MNFLCSLYLLLFSNSFIFYWSNFIFYFIFCYCVAESIIFFHICCQVLLLKIKNMISSLRNSVLSQQTFTCSKSTIETLEKGVKKKFTKKTPELCHWLRSGVFIVNFEHISHQNDAIDVVLVSLLLTLNIFHTFEQVNAGWVSSFENYYYNKFIK